MAKTKKIVKIRVLHRIVMKLAQNKRNLNKGVYE